MGKRKLIVNKNPTCDSSDTEYKPEEQESSKKSKSSPKNSLEDLQKNPYYTVDAIEWEKYQDYTKNLDLYGISKNAPFICPDKDCAKTFKSRWNLSCHYKKHLNIKPFKCRTENCNKTFKTKTEIKLHVQTHLSTGERNKFACSSCKMVFYRSSDLQDHDRYYHGPEENKYKCEYCDKVFERRGAFSMHKKFHLGEFGKSLACGICDEKFFTKAHLSEHYAKWHGCKPEELQKYSLVIRDRASSEKIQTLSPQTPVQKRPRNNRAPSGPSPNYEITSSLGTTFTYNSIKCKECGKLFTGSSATKLYQIHLDVDKKQFPKMTGKRCGGKKENDLQKPDQKSDIKIENNLNNLKYGPKLPQFPNRWKREYRNSDSSSDSDQNQENNSQTENELDEELYQLQNQSDEILNLEHLAHSWQIPEEGCLNSIEKTINYVSENSNIFENCFPKLLSDPRADFGEVNLLVALPDL